MATISEFTLGTTVRFTATFKDASNEPTDVSSAVIKIVDPIGTVKISSGTMSKESKGIYYYNWQSSASDNDGVYSITVTCVASDGYTSVKTIDLIEMKSKVDA